MKQCPCCSQLMVRCIRKDGVYWFCSSCWQEMPDLDSLMQFKHKTDLEHNQKTLTKKN
jgi:hypothetical protein